MPDDSPIVNPDDHYPNCCCRECVERKQQEGDRRPEHPIVELRTIMCKGHGCGPCFLIVNADQYDNFPHDGFCWVDGTKEILIQAPGVPNISRGEIEKLQQVKVILNDFQEEKDHAG